MILFIFTSVQFFFKCFFFIVRNTLGWKIKLFFTQMEYIVCIAEPAHLSNSS